MPSAIPPPVPSPSAPASTRSTAVVICTYTLDRWDDLAAAVESMRAQTTAPADIVVVIDHNDELHRRAAAAWPDLRVIANHGPQGLSGARNTGAEAATAEIVA